MNKVTTSTLIIFFLIAGWVFYLTNIKKDDSLTEEKVLELLVENLRG